MRYTAVYDRADQADIPLDAAIRQTGRFKESLQDLGGVTDGFAEEIDLETLNSRAEFDREAMRQESDIRHARSGGCQTEAL